MWYPRDLQSLHLMAHTPLTDLAIRGLSPPPGQRAEIWDSKVPGLGVRASGHGTKSWVLMYRFDGRKRRLGLGRYPTVSLAEARKLANNALNQVAHGIDPEPKILASSTAPTFANIIDQFVEKHCRQHNRANTAHETERILRSRFLPLWRDRLVAEISKSEVRECIEAIAKAGTPSAANHALAAIRKFFNWCVDQDLLVASPCDRLRKPAPASERERVLSDTELTAVWRATHALTGPYPAIIKLLVLTAQRRGEVTGMCWSEIDADNKTWTIPGRRTKNHTAHTVPLTSAALDVINALPRLHDDLVFPARGNDTSTFSGFSKLKRELDRVAGVSDFTLHDLRRTAATGMAKLGVSPHVVERVLNHASGTFAGVAGVYNRFAYLPEMRDALERWSAHLDGLAQKTKS